MSTNYERSSPPRVLSALLPLLLLLVLACTIFLVWRIWLEGRSANSPDARPRPVAARGDLSAAEQANIEIYERVAPSVVHVTNLAQRGDLLSLNVQQVPRGTGSGFVWDKEGHIVTNYHVVAGADAAQVILSDHSSYAARQVWAYPDGDVAVLRIDAPPSKLHPILIGTSHDLKVGQVVYAIGNPFGLDQTMTNGIVSALGREIHSESGRPIQGVIQTSAAINPGNSGGPLLDSAGRLIGMNTAIVSPSGAFAGVGFAIPVDEINRVVPQLIRHGKVARPMLGVQVAEDQLAQGLGVEHGALVIRVVPDSPAASAGLQGTRRDESGQIHLGDVIIAVDGQPIQDAKELNLALEKYKVGETVTVSILRNGQRNDLKATLQVVK